MQALDLGIGASSSTRCLECCDDLIDFASGAVQNAARLLGEEASKLSAQDCAYAAGAKDAEQPWPCARSAADGLCRCLLARSRFLGGAGHSRASICSACPEHALLGGAQRTCWCPHPGAGTCQLRYAGIAVEALVARETDETDFIQALTLMMDSLSEPPTARFYDGLVDVATCIHQGRAPPSAWGVEALAASVLQVLP